MNTYIRFFVILVGIILLTGIITGVTLRKTQAQDNQRQQQERAQQLANLPPGTELVPSMFNELSIGYTLRYSVGAPTFLTFYSGKAETTGSHWFEWRLQSFKLGEFLFNVAWMAVVASLVTRLLMSRWKNGTNESNS